MRESIPRSTSVFHPGARIQTSHPVTTYGLAASPSSADGRFQWSASTAGPELQKNVAF